MYIMVHQTTNTSENPHTLESSQDSLLQNNQSDTQESTCAGSIPNVDLTRLKTKQSRKIIPFWAKDPNILLNQKYVFEFFPVEGMTFSQKLNAITRLVIVMTTFSFLYTQSTRLMAIGAMSILAIFLLHFAYQKERGTREGLGAGRMTHDPSLPLPGPHNPIMSGKHDFNMSPEQFSNTFDQSTPDNPLSNVLIPDYIYDVDKKPAPPSFTRKGYDNILDNAKKMVEEQNPGQPDIADKLFGDLGDEIDFEKSLQPFYSTANTTIPNDQRAFAEFCYGDMTSAKEGNMLALGRNNPRWINGSN